MIRRTFAGSIFAVHQVSMNCVDKSKALSRYPWVELPNVNYCPDLDEALTMLQVANVTKNDVVYDLGCGDGRIPVTAARKYGARGYRYALIESGAAMQSVYLTATELDVPLRAIGGIDDGRVPEFLGLPDSAVALLALILG